MAKNRGETIEKYQDAKMDWRPEYLEINTVLANLTDYIFYPNLVGLDMRLPWNRLRLRSLPTEYRGIPYG